jgi:hypothetical protein
MLPPRNHHNRTTPTHEHQIIRPSLLQLMSRRLRTAFHKGFTLRVHTLSHVRVDLPDDDVGD